MDSPKVPDDTRGWDSIDIFLFTNGQDYSPPRKYHLQTEELKWWDATLNLLARSQFGSVYSNIELYTLEGKKINTPLELTNDAAYVAVKPPDTFVQTGYEKYLLKASRSWEKRHERPLRNTDYESENIEKNREQIKSNLYIIIPDDEKINNNGTKKDDGLPLDINTKHLVKVQNNTFAQSLRDTESVQPNGTTNNSLKTQKPELLQRRKPGNNTKSTILKKLYPNPKSKDDGSVSNKKRTTSFPKNLIKSSNNSKRLPVSSNNTNIMKTNLEEIFQPKEQAQINTIKTGENIREAIEITEQLKNDPIMKTSPGTSVKDFTVLSNIYKNTENDMQSVYLDADREKALGGNEQRLEVSALENRETQKNCLQSNTENRQQSTSNLSEIQPYNVNQPGTLNINLNIALKGYTVFKTDDDSQANKDKTYMKSIKPDKASQVNIDVNLSKEILNFGNEVSRREPAESSIAKPCEEKFADNKTKVIVHCKCNLLKSETPSPCNFKENDYYIIVLPAEINDLYIPRKDLEIREGSLREIQELLHSCIRVPVSSNSEITSNKKPNTVMKHKVSISQDAPKEFDIDDMQLKSQGDNMETTLIKNHKIEPNYKIDNFSQTEWCNTLLQAKCNEDGHYTFHMPPLDLLKHYNLI